MSNKDTANIQTKIDHQTMIIERTFQAPIQYVYTAWSDANHLGRWFGPEGFTITTQSFEFVEGGTWSYTMHGPDGTDYDNLITFTEIIENEKIVYLHGDSENPEWFKTTILFMSEGAHTSIRMMSTFKSVVELEQAINEFKALDGGISTLSRLAKAISMVQFISAKESQFAVERIFDAPRSLVFDVFTKAEHLCHWWGPEGWALPVCDIDFRVGGKWHYCMREINGEMESCGLSVFQQIIVPELIVQIDSFSDADGNINESLPTMKLTTQFIDLGHTTRVVSETEYASAEELQAALDMGMIYGLTESWNRLVYYINSLEHQ